jgi:Tol biopolymer transport system component
MWGNTSTLLRGLGALLAVVTLGALATTAAAAHPARPRSPTFVVSIARASLGSDALYRTDTRRWVGRAAGVDPAYSPAARAVAFDHPGPGFSNHDVYTVGLDGRSARRVGANAGWFPTWSPDGKRIATACRFAAITTATAVCITDVAHRSVRQLVGFRAPRGGDVWVDGLAWSPDGSTLAVAKGKRPRRGSVYALWPDKLLLLDLRTGRMSAIATLSFSNLAWSADSSRIAFWRRCDIVVRTLATGREDVVHVRRCDDIAEGPIFLSSDGSTVYYAVRTAIEAAPLGGGRRQRVVRLPHVLDGGAALVSG